MDTHDSGDDEKWILFSFQYTRDVIIAHVISADAQIYIYNIPTDAEHAK